MAKPYATANETSSTVAAENPFTHGTDETIVLTSATGFPSGGGYIRVYDATAWALYEYTAISTNTLTGLTACTLGTVESDASHEFAAGSTVALVQTAEYLADKQTELDTCIHDDTAGEIVAITEKTSPVGADEILAEDSADSNAKKSIKLSSLGSAGVPMKSATAVTLYVDTGGNDSTGDGSSGTPYLTIGKAIAHFVEKYAYINTDCTIAVGGGTFSITAALDLAGLTIPGSLTIKAMDTSDNELYTIGTAGAGADTTITLEGGDSWATDFWAGASVWIHCGTGLGQSRTVISSTDADPCVLTISSGATDWGTNPDNTSDYVVSGKAIIEDGASVNNALIGESVNLSLIHI